MAVAGPSPRRVAGDKPGHTSRQRPSRRLQRILYRSSAAVSATAPLASWIAAEGEGRQEALAELEIDHARLDAVLDQHQRELLTRLFVATRSELQAPPERP